MHLPPPLLTSNIHYSPRQNFHLSTKKIELQKQLEKIHYTISQNRFTRLSYRN